MRSPTTWSRRTKLASALAFLALVPALAGCTRPDYPPRPADGVADFAGLLSDEQKQSLAERIAKAREEKNLELAVATVGSIRDFKDTSNNSIEAFAWGLFRAWEIGKKRNYTGVLLLVAREDRQVRIELGDAWRRSRDADAQGVMSVAILPACREGDYPRAISNGVDALIVEFDPAHKKPYYGGSYWGPSWALMTSWKFLVPTGIFILFIARSFWRDGAAGWGWTVITAVGDILLFPFRLLGWVADYGGGPRRGFWSSGHYSSWGSFGGSGGGSSSGGSGGGATGSW